MSAELYRLLIDLKALINGLNPTYLSSSYLAIYPLTYRLQVHTAHTMILTPLHHPSSSDSLAPKVANTLLILRESLAARKSQPYDRSGVQLECFAGKRSR